VRPLDLRGDNRASVADVFCELWPVDRRLFRGWRCNRWNSTVASNQLTEKSNADLTRAAAIIERLEKQVSTVIGDEWTPLDTEQVEKLRSAIAAVPFKGTIQVMYLNAFGKSFAQSLATAFRAALLMGALAEVIDPKVLVNIGADEESSFFIIGVGSKPAH
jgi:hypothetical protein